MPESEPRVFKTFIKGSIDAVWREITKTDSAQVAMFNMMLVTPGLRPGAPIRILTKNGKYTPIVGEVVEYDPPRRYVHTFRFTRYSDAPCKVAYDLVETAGGVEFTMTITELTPGSATEKQMLQGGSLIINTLKSVVETGKAPLGVRVLYTLFSLLEPLSPQATKTENWP